MDEAGRITGKKADIKCFVEWKENVKKEKITKCGSVNQDWES